MDSILSRIMMAVLAVMCSTLLWNLCAIPMFYESSLRGRRLSIPVTTVAEIRAEIDGSAATGTKGVVKNDGSNITVEAKRRLQEVPSSGTTCTLESKARALLLKYMNINYLSTGSVAPMFIRGVFHDAMDANNLLKLDANGWTSFDSSAKPDGSLGWLYGGVDGCMYSPLASTDREAKHCEDAEKEGSSPCPSTQHNRNLAPAFNIAGKVCQELGVQRSADCVVDMMVLGAIVAVADAGGPAMKMLWGRKQGNCLRIEKETKALNLSPKLFALDELSSFRATWDELGFSAREETALMGAHTFGKLNVCVGGLNGVHRGHSCNDPAKMSPPLTEHNLFPNCKPEVRRNGSVAGDHCWIKGKRSSSGGCGNLPCTYAPELHPLYPIHGRYYEARKSQLEKAGYVMLDTDNEEFADIAIGEGFPDGGIWDQTPEKFDNNYFQLLQGEELNQKDACCGPAGYYKDRKYNVKGRVCLEVGDERKCIRKGLNHNKGLPFLEQCFKMHNRSKRGELAQPSAELCDAKWCRYGDKKGRSHMKSPTLWHETKHDFVKKSHKHGAYKRIIRLAGDWALLSDETKQYVEEFAADERQFFAAFDEAFQKVMQRGYADAQLTACV